MKTTSQFTINGSTQIVKLTEKAKGIKAFSIKGNRWFQKSYGNTYHVAYIGAMINGKWVELGATDMQYGYGDHFLVSAGAWLIENGFVECENEYFLSDYNVREDFAIEYYSQDVTRKRDL